MIRDEETVWRTKKLCGVDCLSEWPFDPGATRSRSRHDMSCCYVTGTLEDLPCGLRLGLGQEFASCR